jgi:hypothetical protein
MDVCDTQNLHVGERSRELGLTVRPYLKLLLQFVVQLSRGTLTAGPQPPPLGAAATGSHAHTYLGLSLVLPLPDLAGLEQDGDLAVHLALMGLQERLAGAASTKGEGLRGRPETRRRPPQETHPLFTAVRGENSRSSRSMLAWSFREVELRGWGRGAFLPATNAKAIASASSSAMPRLKRRQEAGGFTSRQRLPKAPLGRRERAQPAKAIHRFPSATPLLGTSQSLPHNHHSRRKKA